MTRNSPALPPAMSVGFICAVIVLVLVKVFS